MITKWEKGKSMTDFLAAEEEEEKEEEEEGEGERVGGVSKEGIY